MPQAQAPKYTRKWVGKLKRPLSPPSPRSDNNHSYQPNQRSSTTTTAPANKEEAFIDTLPEDPLDTTPQCPDSKLLGFDANGKPVTSQKNSAIPTPIRDPRMRPGDKKPPKLVQVQPVSGKNPPKPKTPPPPPPTSTNIPSLLTLPVTPGRPRQRTIFSGNVYVINGDQNDPSESHHRPRDADTVGAMPLPGPGEPTWSYSTVCAQMDIRLLEIRDMLTWLTTKDTPDNQATPHHDPRPHT